jgi:branched-chain amino acid aminotransferase
MSLKIWIDGQLKSTEDATVSVLSHALHYGTGVFEGIRSYPTAHGAAVFRLREHMLRMQRGAAALGMVFPVEQCEAAIIETLSVNHQAEAYVRPLAWYADGGLGLDLGKQTAHLMVATISWASHLGGHKVRVTVSPMRRNTARAMPALKLTGGYTNATMAKLEAVRRGFEEALFVDDAGMVVECTGENVFLVKDGQVVASEHPDALGGITRQTAIELTGAQVRPVSLAELKAADEVFLTGTSAEICAVDAIDERVYGDNPVTRDLSALYQRIVHGEEPTYAGWLTHYAPARAPTAAVPVTD